MFNPKFQILIEKKFFYPDEVICLGSQLNAIVSILKEILAPHIWYAANVDAYGDLPTRLDLNSFYFRKIGDDSLLSKLCLQIDQFLSGVFIAIEIDHSHQTLDLIEADTEDERFRPLPINGVLIEIRAFDTSFFALFSENEDLIKELAKKFSVEIDKAT